MELRPGYKQTDIGHIPEDWDVTTVGTEFSIQLGKMIDAEKNIGILKPYLGNRAVQWGRIALDEIGNVRLTPSDLQRFLLQKGDLLVCEGGEIGRAAIWHQQLEECYFQKALHRLRPLRDYNISLMQNVLLHLATRGVLNNFVTQTSIAHLPKDKFLTVPIPLPPTSEQNAIAVALSDVDDLIESLEQLIAKKRQVKQGAMQVLLTGKERLPGFTDLWQTKRLIEFGVFLKGTGVTKSQTSSGDLPCVRYGEIYTRHKNFIREFSSWISREVALTATRLRTGEVLFAASGETKEEIGKCVAFLQDVEAYAGGDIIILRPNKNVADPLFLGYYLNTTTIAQQKANKGQGDAIVHIGIAALATITGKIPQVDEQIAIGRILWDIDAEISSLEAKNLKARQIKQGMMHELLTGRVRLVQSESSVLPFRAKEQGATTPKKGHNSAINEAVIISVLAKNFGSNQYPLGRKRYTKLSYLLHRHAEGRVEGYLEKAAGPYNPSTKYKGAEKIALSNRYVRSHARDNFSGFVVAEKIAEAEGYFSKWYGDETIKWLEQFRYKKNDELELLATVDMAMVNLRTADQQVNLASVKRYLHEAREWTAKLSRSIFSDENIDTAIKWSRQLFEPDGDDG